MIADPASWLEVPVIGDVPICGLDLLAARRDDLVFRLALQHGVDPESVLHEFEPDWRSTYRVTSKSSRQTMAYSGFALENRMTSARTPRSPAAEDDLYLARGDEVIIGRRLLTGDVMADILIPGVASEPSLGMIVTHPCSMTTDGVNMIPALHVAKVEPSDQIAWASCPRDRIPLPGLEIGFQVVRFDLIGMVDTAVLRASQRLVARACAG